MTDEKLFELAREASAEWRDPDYFCACELCDGTGNGMTYEGQAQECPDCGGSGWIEL